MTVDYHEHTDGESTGPIHHERPPQRTAIVRIDGLPVGWAKVTQGPPEIGVRISQIVIHENNIEQNSNIFFGISDDDETPQVDVAAPREPGFYRYTDGRQTMLFLLKDNREVNRFFREQEIEVVENEFQWYAVFDNGSMDKCEWGYIEQALVGDNELVKVG